MSWLVLYLTPIGLGALFLLYALLKALVNVVAFVGIFSDIFCNYTFFRVFGPYPWKGLKWKERTVTARTNAAAKRGEKWAIVLAKVLNAFDPGHCDI